MSSKNQARLTPLSLGQLTDGENRLQRDFGDLARAWGDVKGEWFDGQRDRFERQHLASLGPSLSRMVAQLRDFSDAAHRAARELEDPENASTDADATL